jgi:hypothetical protein
MDGLFSNPMILILLVVGALLPIINGKTILQILLDLLIPKPPKASAQAWQHWTGLAEQALARGDTSAAEDYAARAAKEAAQYREQEMEFTPGGILQWMLKLITGGAGGGLMPLLIIGVVVMMVMGGGCPQMAPKLEAEAEAVEATAMVGAGEYFVSTVSSPWNPLPEPAPVEPLPDPAPLQPIEAAPLDPVESVVVPAVAPVPIVVRQTPRRPLRSWIASRPLRSWIASRPLRRLLCRR